jgi:hypothetical protein
VIETSARAFSPLGAAVWIARQWRDWQNSYYYVYNRLIGCSTLAAIACISPSVTDEHSRVLLPDDTTVNLKSHVTKRTGHADWQQFLQTSHFDT